ncbi:unknown similar to AMEV102 [Mythimna separata entomopoxvirus 'L']|uniref:Uncharacterized protein n=1 Tax=Mythimna separata entomopoxvirus 'L' TaxID=1293572 RepID=A0A916KQ77_9POXV|nr:unknown similar to AMEV102 [Mythimna separata entomopoxvirus 'L']CCU56317.1 unknown similar to AMEV102 [Mythimna separata entomopoxvirus 'L']
MKISFNKYDIELYDINFYSQYNFKSFFQIYYHNNIDYCSNVDYIKLFNLFTLEDFLSLANNKITNNILDSMNKLSTIDLYKVMQHGYKYFDKNMLYDIFVPFGIIKVYKDKINIKNNIINPDLKYFENVIDINKFNREYYDYKYVIN